MPLPLLPSLSVKWGPYDQPDPDEEQKIVTTVRTAVGGGTAGEPLITKRLAVEKLREVFDIENVDAVLDELEKESEERQQKALQHTTAEAEALGAIAHAGPTGQRGGPPKGAGPGGGANGGPAAKAPSGKK